MAGIPLYLLDKDVEFLNDWINQEEEIAFLVTAGHKRWIVKKEHAMLTRHWKANRGTRGSRV